MTAIANQLKKIQVVNGYANDIARVFRQDFRIEQLNEAEVPYAMVLAPPNGGKLEPMDANAYMYRWTLTCGVGTKKPTTDTKDETLETTMESLVNDLWRALLEDPVFSGTATSSIHDSVLSDGPYVVDPDIGIGAYNCTLQVDLVFQRSDL